MKQKDWYKVKRILKHKDISKQRYKQTKILSSKVKRLL